MFLSCVKEDKKVVSCENLVNDKNEKPEIGLSGFSESALKTEATQSASNVADSIVLRNDGIDMASGFLKLNKSEKTEWLMENHPNAFLLLTLIATRARRNDNHIDGLTAGMAYVGDYKKCGIETRDKYRTALDVLIACKLVEKVKTCRSKKTSNPHPKSQNRKNSPTSIPTKGTVVKLLNSDIYDINLENDPHLDPHLTPTSPPRTRSKEYNPYEAKSIDVPSKEIKARCNGRLHRSAAPAIFFSFESKKFENISDADYASWKEAYPEINVAQELARACEWVLSNPSKEKKAWRRFLTGWFSRENERKYNKKPFQAYSKTNNRLKRNMESPEQDEALLRMF
jgi:hypothetical protein